MNEVSLSQLKLISKCGLYCGNCKKFKLGKCAGCVENEKASWCKVRTCCLENAYSTCADCTQKNPHKCKSLNSFISSAFSFIFRRDRRASIDFIKSNGPETYIRLMDCQNRMAIRK